jgi:acyl carrier protein
VSASLDPVRRYIVDELKWPGSADDLTDDYPLLENKVLDSLGLFKLVTFLEAEYGVQIPDEQLLPSNFGSLGAIGRLLAASGAD